MNHSKTLFVGRVFCCWSAILIAAAARAQDGSFVIVDDEASAASTPQGTLTIVPQPTAKPAKEAKPTQKKLTPVTVTPPRQSPPRSNFLIISQEARNKPTRVPPQDDIAIRTQPVLQTVITEPAALNEIDQSLVDAHTASTTAMTETEFSEVIDKCITAIRQGAEGENKKFANHLISWSLNRRGQIYADGQKPELAEADFAEALHFDPTNWRALHNRGVSHAQAGRFAEAFDDFNRVIELNPMFAKAFANRATLFVEAGDLASAEEDYLRACRLDAKLASTRVGLARTCHLAGRWEEALTHFDQATELDPKNPGILCSRGDLLADMGRYADALADYANAIELEPRFAHAYRNGAWLLATCPDEQFHDPQNAIMGARQALEFEYGDRHVALDTLAAALASAGEFEEAVSTLEEAIEIAPSAMRAEYVARIKLYEAGQPFRMEPAVRMAQTGLERK